MPFKPITDLNESQRIVSAVVAAFGMSQQKLGELLECDQSTISGWIVRGTVTDRRQKQLIALSKELVVQGKMTRPIEPNDFHELRDNRDMQQAA
jgi:hypothetical protein